MRYDNTILYFPLLQLTEISAIPAYISPTFVEKKSNKLPPKHIEPVIPNALTQFYIVVFVIIYMNIIFG